MPSTRSFVNASKDTLAAQWGMSSCYAASRGPLNLKKWHLHVGEWIRWLNQRSGWEPWGFSNGGTHLGAQIFRANLYGQTWVICPKKIVHEVWGWLPFINPRGPQDATVAKWRFTSGFPLPRTKCFVHVILEVTPRDDKLPKKLEVCIYNTVYIYIHMWVNYMNLISHTNL